ncbi:MAG: isochorismatase family cysteine hydrolase [Chloroflexota bacterium]|nr:isochorismatase family cysteine hydrolase [Chloroflexota bacterium]
MNTSFIPEGTVEVPEISLEDGVRLPAQKTAVIVVDMQNDFVKEEGNLVVPAAGETVASIQQLLEAARAHDVHIAYTQDTQVENDPEFDVWPQHCLQGTWGWEIIEELEPHPQDLICQKNRYDGFYGTWLDHFLSRIWNVKHLVIVGTVANICVLHTAASAGLRYFHVVVPANGISALTDFGQAVALRQISWLYNGSVVRSVEDIRFEG